MVNKELKKFFNGFRM